MPDYSTSIQGPNLSGLDQGVSPIGGSSRAATANLIATVGKMAGGLYGQSQAKKRGQAIGGEGETYEVAGLVADQAAQELAGLGAAKKAEQGVDVTQDQALDLRNQVFGKVLTNQKRIKSALDRGLISSTEATARLSVLRNEALANPLVAPYQDQLDNALYETTGGSGTTFAPTAEEAQAAAANKGRLAAIEETQKQVTSMLQTGIASSEKQALNYIAQTEQAKRDMEYLAAKKAQLGLSSQEVSAANQHLQTQQAATAFSAIAGWQAAGGDTKMKQSLQLQFVRDGELTKQAIRATAFDKNGKLVIDQDALASQIAEVDRRVKEFTSMIDDQSGTKQITDQIAQLTASMDLKSAEVNVDLSKRLPILYALKDQPVFQKWYIDAVTGTNKLKTDWGTATSPIKRMLAQLPNSELNDTVAKANTTFIQGGVTNQTDQAVLSTTLMDKGGSQVSQETYKNNPDETLKTLSNTPFSIKAIANNDEWKRLASTPEGKDQMAAIIQGAASRALVSSVYSPDRAGAFSEGVVTGRGNTRYKSEPSFAVPSEVSVVRNEKKETTGGGRGGSNQVGKRFEEWTIDTKGVPVSDVYKSEIVNAYKLGTEKPEVWNEDFKSIDEWLNHLFTRPKVQ